MLPIVPLDQPSWRNVVPSAGVLRAALLRRVLGISQRSTSSMPLDRSILLLPKSNACCVTPIRVASISRSSIKSRASFSLR